MVIIPFTEYSYITKEVTLDNINYKLLFTWNTRMEAWVMSILKLDDTPILAGIKLVLNYELIAKFHHLDIPQGLMYVVDTSNDESKIAFDDFTSERGLRLIYIEEDEVESVSA